MTIIKLIEKRIDYLDKQYNDFDRYAMTELKQLLIKINRIKLAKKRKVK